ncbi:hypothetical protein [Oceanibium sediminis]|uniref:hypothetical protein n=1 Tax=Oceanibium sediminis TaxID=2026339 RepID=UPI000DD3D07C|nr:hypothetical protein [Oceanibium sediminis]
MKLLLHIGTEKTGSTAFQEWAQANRRALLAQGVWLAQSLGVPNHRALSVMARTADEVEDGFAKFGVNSPRDHAAFRALRSAALRDEVAAARASGATVFLITSEHCHSRMKTQAAVDFAAGLLRPFFASIEIVCFLRPQADMGLSLGSTMSRCGLHISGRLVRSIGPGNSYYDYHGMLTRWAKAFGDASIVPVPFRPGPVPWLEDRLGLNTEGFVPEARVNRRLDYRTVALMNQIVGPSNDGARSDVPPICRDINAEEVPCTDPLSLSRADVAAITAKFADGNAALCARWGSVTVADLTPDLSRCPEVGTLEQLEQADTAPVLRHVIGRRNAELALARAEALLLKSMLAEQAGKREDAIALLDQALPLLDKAATFELTAAWAGEQAQSYRARLARLRSAKAGRPRRARPVLVRLWRGMNAMRSQA